MSAPDYAQYSPKILLALMEAFSNRISVVNWILLLLWPHRAHGSLRGRKGPSQHLVRSAGAAMSTAGSRGVLRGPRPSVAVACTLAPSGNLPSEATPGWILVKVSSDGCRLLGPVEWLPRPPHAVQNRGEFSGKRHARLAGA